MKLWEVSTKQSKVALISGSIIFLSSGTKLSGTFDIHGDQFLCKKNGRFFVSTIGLSETYGPYVDNVQGKEAIKLEDLDAMYLIKDESDTWPPHRHTASS